MFIYCGKANRQAYNTANVCFQMTAEIRDKSIESMKLLAMAEFGSIRCPTLTAANVFPVNIPAYLGIIGSLTGYVIVLVQINAQF